jgi:hypothetical protein
MLQPTQQAKTPVVALHNRAVRCGWGVAGLLAATGLMLAGCGREPPPRPDFDFTRIGADGALLEQPGEGEHHCVLDGRTGLWWEVKRATPGLHDRDALYTWYHSDKSEHLGEPGLAGGGECSLERCDTEAFVAAVNAAGLCGRNDWRLPSRDEALTILDGTRVGTGPTLDPQYFPDTVKGEYWTGTTFRLYPQGAWVIDTIYALDRVDGKFEPKRVRLVSGPRDAVKPKGRGR